MSLRKKRIFEENDGKPTSGSIVWTTLNKRSYWPAMVIPHTICGCGPPKKDHTWVFWFGDHRVSEVPWNRISPFKEDYHKIVKSNCMARKWRIGIIEAIRECASEGGHFSDNWTQDYCVTWADKGFQPADPNIIYKPRIPQTVMSHLGIVRKKIEESSEFSEQALNETQLSIQKGIKNRSVLLETVCVGCYSPNVIGNHPLFVAKVCNICQEKIKSSLYAFGNDGINYFCAVCTKPGDVLVCDNKNCGRVYCYDCIDTLCAKNARVLIAKKSPWCCFLCANFIPKINGILVKRDDWQRNVMNIFKSTKLVADNHPVPKEKHALRVLSLFDGIGTGRLVLENLNLDIEAYYSYEIDQDAINVLKINYKDKITHMGNVRNCTAEIINEIGPIDLVLGASPCNDLSLVNPFRKGIFETSGTGVLFFEFYRILTLVQEQNKDRDVFWLFENVAAMTKETKETINRFLAREPCMLDAQWFSPQHRARFFWGNIPGLYGNIPVSSESGPELKDYLTAHTNRTAITDKIRTVTTNPNSLKQGTEMKNYPVQTSNEVGDTLWITELEVIFGFPRHYTDVGNISLINRQQLLGRAWSVPVITHILQPLKNYYKKKTDMESSTSDIEDNIPEPITNEMISNASFILFE